MLISPLLPWVLSQLLCLSLSLGKNSYAEYGMGLPNCKVTIV